MHHYDATSIRILSEDEIDEAFDWAKATALSIKYGGDPNWILRGLVACQSVGVASTYFIHRYLEKNREIPFHEGVDAAFRELWLEKVITQRKSRDQ